MLIVEDRIESGWLRGVTALASPNCDERPPGTVIDLLVVHGISLPPGEFGGPYIADLFTNRLDPSLHPYFHEIRDLRVSAHALIRRDGGVIQFVSFDHRAWHAGRSSFRGRERCNDYSVGIELEGADDVAYTAAQYRRLAMLASTLMRSYPAITEARIAGHSDVAPGRKTDPGPAFEWACLRRLLEATRQAGAASTPVDTIAKRQGE